MNHQSSTKTTCCCRTIWSPATKIPWGWSMDAWRPIYPAAPSLQPNPKRHRFACKLLIWMPHALVAALTGDRSANLASGSPLWTPHSRMTAGPALQEITPFGGDRNIRRDRDMETGEARPLSREILRRLSHSRVGIQPGRRPFINHLQRITTEEARMAALQMLAGSHVASLKSRVD